MQARLLWPRRVFPGPLLPPAYLLFEWAALGLAAFSFAAGWRRQIWARLACAVLAVSLWQAFMNQKALLFLTFAYLAIDAPEPEGDRSSPVLALIRRQVLIVYVFSAVNKLQMGFQSGSAMTALFRNIALMPNQPLVSFPGASALSGLVIALELAILPLALLRRPRLGVALVAAFHLSMSLLMPDIWIFSAVMIADSLLFIVVE